MVWSVVDMWCGWVGSHHFEHTSIHITLIYTPGGYKDGLGGLVRLASVNVSLGGLVRLASVNVSLGGMVRLAAAI